MSVKKFSVIMTIGVFLIIAELIYNSKNIEKVNYNSYDEEDYMREIVYSAESYCLKSKDFGGARIDFSDYNDELKLDFEAPVEGVLVVNSDCKVSVLDEIVIGDLMCDYTDSKISCKKTR